MQTVIRKLGNSAGLIVPASMMKELGFRVDQSVDLSSVDGCLVAKPLKKPRYILTELVAQMEGKLPQVEGWENMPAVGLEID